MAGNRKYYYLLLKSFFFDGDAIVPMENTRDLFSRNQKRADVCNEQGNAEQCHPTKKKQQNMEPRGASVLISFTGDDRRFFHFRKERR